MLKKTKTVSFNIIVSNLFQSMSEEAPQGGAMFSAAGSPAVPSNNLF